MIRSASPAAQPGRLGLSNVLARRSFRKAWFGLFFLFHHRCVLCGGVNASDAPTFKVFLGNILIGRVSAHVNVKLPQTRITLLEERLSLDVGGPHVQGKSRSTLSYFQGVGRWFVST